MLFCVIGPLDKVLSVNATITHSNCLGSNFPIARTSVTQKNYFRDYHGHQNKYRAQKLFLGINSVIFDWKITANNSDPDKFGNFGTGEFFLSSDLFWMKQGKKYSRNWCGN